MNEKKSVSVAFMVCGLIFSTCLIVANIIEQKTIRLGSLEATAGLLIFPVSYIINDLIAEVWGYKKARLLIWCGFLMNFLAVAFFNLAIWAPGSENFRHQESFNMVLGNTFRLTLSSFAAFLCGSFVNAYVMSKMKKRHQGKRFSLRAILSTLLGEGLDSVVFFHLAFWGVLPAKSLYMLILTQTLMKTAYEMLILPVTGWVVRKLKQIESCDTIDGDISYNPFRIGDL